MIRKTETLRWTPLTALAGLAAAATLAACASPVPADAHVTREPLPYGDMARSLVVRNAPQQTTRAQPAAAVASYSAPQPAARPVQPRPIYSAPPAPTRTATPAVRVPVAQPVVTRPAVSQPVVTRPVSSQPTTVPVATHRVSAPSTPVVSRSATVPAPRVSGTVGDASMLPQFEAHELWVADELSALSTERRALQGLMSAHYGYEGDPSPARREKIREKVETLRDVARIARSIDENSSRADVEAIESEVSSQAQDLTDRRRDVTRVIIAIKSFRKDSSATAEQSLVRALERYTEGSR